MDSKGGKGGRCGTHWEIGIDIYTPCVLSHFSHVQLFAILWTVAHQDPMSTGFSRQEYSSGLPCPPPGDLSGLGPKPNLLQLLHCRRLLYCESLGKTIYIYYKKDN